MTTVRLTLPDALAKEAREAGLLTPKAMERLLLDALRRRAAAERLLEIADRLAETGIAPMSMEEINAEVMAARAERRKREAGR